MKDPSHASSPHARALLCLLLGACAASPEPEIPVPAPLSAFSEMAAFLLPGHQSYAFLRMPELDDTGTQIGSELSAMCGSDFRSPRGIGVGAFRGVTVSESKGPEPDEQESGTEQLTLGGIPVWHRPEDTGMSGYAPEAWWAHADGRFTVHTNQRRELELALKRSTRIQDLLAPFADMPPLPLDTESVIYLYARPQNRNLFGAPYATERMRISFGADRRMRICHRRLFSSALDFIPNPQNSGTPQFTIQQENGWKVTTAKEPVDAYLLPGYLLVAFGLKIFI